MGIMPRKFHCEDLKTKRSLRHKLSVYGYARILKKMGIIIEPLELASQKVCHEHQHFIWIVCSKFHWSDIKEEKLKKGH